MINSILIPAIVILLMVIVGTGLTPKHFATVIRSPLPLLGATLLQSLALPLAALIILVLIRPQPELAIGLLLMAAAPGGALSNYYCHLGGLNAALSVMLTAASSIAAFFLMPVVLAISFSLILERQEIAIAVPDLIIRLMLILLLPVGFGMLLRHRYNDTVKASASTIRTFSLILVVMLLALIIFDQWSTTRRILLDAVVLTATFTMLALLIGWFSARLLNMNTNDRYATTIEFAVRNAGIAAVVAASSLGRPEFAAFGALFVVFQFPIVLVLINFYRVRQNRGVTKEVNR